MTGAAVQFSREFSERLKALRAEHNRHVWGRIIARKQGKSRAWQQLQILLDSEKHLAHIRKGAWRAEGRAAGRQGLYYRLIIRNHLRTDPVLSGVLKRANALIGTFESGPAIDTHASALHSLLNDDSRKRRRDVWRRREQLEEKLHPLVMACIRRRNRIARDFGYEGFADLWADICGLGRAQADAILDAADVAIKPFYDRLTGKWRIQGQEPAPWDMLYMVNRPLRPFDALFSYKDLLPVYQDFTRRIGFDERARQLSIHPLDTPYNALTFIESVPGRIHILCNQTNGLRVWKILYHEFGHFLCARYNAQDDYAFQWEDSPCYHECMGQVFNLFTGNERWLSCYIGDAAAEVGAYDGQADIYRYSDWLSNAGVERDLYRDPDGPGADFSLIREKTRDFTFPYHYFLNAPFHFENMLMGEFFARLIHREMERRFSASYPFAPGIAGFLMTAFYESGSSEDWKKKIGEITGLSWERGDLALQAGTVFGEKGSAADAADDRILV